MDARRTLTWLGLLLGAAGLVLQFGLSMQLGLSRGRDIPGALGHFFSFYTILTNIALVLIYLSEVTPARSLAVFRLPLVRGMMAANIALVGLYVFFVLRHLNVLEGLFLLADIVLHYVTPVVYVAWWLLGPHGQLRFGNLPRMLAPTLAYFAYIMLRGLWVQQYPYPILNAIELGYAQVALNAVYMSVALGLLMAIVVGVDGLLGRTRPQHV